MNWRRYSWADAAGTAGLTAAFAALAFLTLMMLYPNYHATAQGPSPQPPDTESTEPFVRLPDSVSGEVGDYIEVASVTNGQQVRWIATSPYLKLFPVHLLRDSKTAVVTAKKPGSYVIYGYTALGGTPSAPSACIVRAIDPDDNSPDPNPDDPDTKPKPPKPSPDSVPGDNFGNIGQTVFSVVSAMPVRSRSHAAATADLYGKAADGLDNGTLVSLNTAASWLQGERAKLWDSDADAWAPFMESAGSAWKKYEPWNNGGRDAVVAYYRAVQSGLSAVK